MLDCNGFLFKLQILQIEISLNSKMNNERVLYYIIFNLNDIRGINYVILI